MKRLIKILYIIILASILTINVYATSGCCSHHGGVDCTRVQSNGKVICNDGSTTSSCDYSSMKKCKGYNPNSSTNKKSSSSNSNTITNNNASNIQKSKNTNLSSVIVNGSNIEISDNMKYETYTNSIAISCKPEDSNATVKIEKPSVFKEGLNNVKVIVVAENGKTQKTYNVEVTILAREKNEENKPKRESVQNVSNEEEKNETIENKEENNSGVYGVIGGVLTVLGGCAVYNKMKN